MYKSGGILSFKMPLFILLLFQYILAQFLE